MNKIKCLVVLLLTTVTVFSPSAWAGSRTASFRVSCTILPALELGAPGALQSLPAGGSQSAATITPARSELALASMDSQVKVNTNLGNQYDFSQKTVKTGAGLSRVYSLTAI